MATRLPSRNVNKRTASGFDNDQEQECQNLICTHPGENATCVQEGIASNNNTTHKTNLPRMFDKIP